MDHLSELLQLVAAIAAIPTILLGMRWLLRPVRVIPSVRMVFDGTEPDEIRATVTNLTGAPIVVVACVARPTYPLRRILARHARHPLTKPRLWPNIWYSAQLFELMGKEPIRMEGKDQRVFIHKRTEHPLYQFLAPMFLVELQLSSGRKFRGTA